MRTLLVLAALAALLIARPVRARESAPLPGVDAPRLEIPPVVTAGAVVTIRWGALPADAEEAELVLSTDGGRSFPVRVSPEIEPRERSYRWRVPDLPAARAVLLLRIGGEDGERAGAVSASFRIAHAEGAPAPDLGFREGGLWAGIAPLRAPGPPDLADAPVLAGVGEAPPCSAPSPSLDHDRPPARARSTVPRPVCAAPAGPPGLNRSRLEVPLRI